MFNYHTNFLAQQFVSEIHPLWDIPVNWEQQHYCQWVEDRAVLILKTNEDSDMGNWGGDGGVYWDLSVPLWALPFSATSLPFFSPFFPYSSSSVVCIVSSSSSLFSNDALSVDSVKQDC